MSREELSEALEPLICEQATGCRGAGDYRRWAREQGYPHLAVVDWTSSAGDWSFIVSLDGENWYFMYQENNYPRGPGFTRIIDEEQYFQGDEESVLEQLSRLH